MAVCEEEVFAQLRMIIDKVAIRTATLMLALTTVLSSRESNKHSNFIQVRSMSQELTCAKQFGHALPHLPQFFPSTFNQKHSSPYVESKGIPCTFLLNEGGKGRL